jgi:glycogen operon protein
MTDNDWHTGYARSLGVFLNGDAITEPGPRGDTVRDQSFLLLFNANREPVTFVLPGGRFGEAWDALIDTASTPGDTAVTYQAASSIELAGRSIMILRGAEARPD